MEFNIFISGEKYELEYFPLKVYMFFCAAFLSEGKERTVVREFWNTF